ncbi:di-heme oxidoredictase family protein [Nitrospira sp. MA-1]|nr:di-heme oxidoredictase family protein [Nitrospira sp. MA-1]
MSLFFLFLVLGTMSFVKVLSGAQAQETDIFQHPNSEQAGIKKSLEQQIGAGRGDINTPDSSLYIINRDPFRSIRRGRNLFQRKFTISQGMGPRNGDGFGDISADASLGAGLADSCAACHGRPRSSAGFGGDVFTRPDSRDAPHLFGLGLIEMLADEITQDLRKIRDQAIARAKGGRGVEVSLKSKGISYGKIRVNPDGSVDPSHLEGVDPDLRVRPFFHHGGTISIREFVVGALNGEMGMEAFDPDLAKAADGEEVVTPSGMVLNGKTDTIETPPAFSESDDSDRDGVANEVPVSLVDHLEFYLLNYFKPAIGRETKDSKRGQRLFQDIQCTSCHIQNLVIEKDRRVADVETTYDRRRGIFNDLFAVATPLFQEVQGSGSPSVKKPKGKRFVVKNIYADFKRHDLGSTYWERNFDGSLTKEFMTEPLWGVGTTAPYGHDGRSIDLWSVIMRHGGEAKDARDRFARLSEEQQGQIIDFLQTLVLFPPDDTASNLNPGDSQAQNFPQYGHGNIALPALFNNPSDLE